MLFIIFFLDLQWYSSYIGAKKYAVFDDWYLYGLCVTDIDLIKEYFRMIADGIAEMPSSEKFKNSVLKEIAIHFFPSRFRGLSALHRLMDLESIVSTAPGIRSTILKNYYTGNYI